MSTLFYIIAVLAYLTPTFIAIKLKQPNKVPVFLANVLLGWSVFGWIAAFVLSLTGPGREYSGQAIKST